MSCRVGSDRIYDGLSDDDRNHGYDALITLAVEKMITDSTYELMGIGK